MPAKKIPYFKPGKELKEYFTESPDLLAILRPVAGALRGDLRDQRPRQIVAEVDDADAARIGDREVESDFQLIAGTNRDLQVEVERGRLRLPPRVRSSTSCPPPEGK